ncbi:DUF4149 domain-containing protein [Gammaproteobacteria bacterium AH-315-C21]|nr:DUF4149 domain-containing protein [Gammaproteobacteria bacterium AH-315-C21]
MIANSGLASMKHYTRFNLGERILLTLWVGGTWTIGYIAAPVLFNFLDTDRQLAGAIAGEMLRAMLTIGLICGVILLISGALSGLNAALKSWRWWLIVAMLVIILVSLFGVHPMVAELKLQKDLMDAIEYKSQFGKLHGLSAAIYLLLSILGLVLVVFGLRRPSLDRI